MEGPSLASQVRRSRRPKPEQDVEKSLPQADYFPAQTFTEVAAADAAPPQPFRKPLKTGRKDVALLKTRRLRARFQGLVAGRYLAS